MNVFANEIFAVEITESSHKSWNAVDYRDRIMMGNYRDLLTVRFTCAGTRRYELVRFNHGQVEFYAADDGVMMFVGYVDAIEPALARNLNLVFLQQAIDLIQKAA